MRYIAIFFLCIFLSLGYAAYDAYRFLTTPVEQPGTDISFEVARGATFDRVVWDLKKAGLITDVKRFQLLGRYKKALGSIKAGEYILSSSLTPPQVLEQLLKGQAHLVRLTIREGLPWWETARAIEKQGFATYEDFKAVIHDADFLKRHAIPFDNAEGFLFPDTYLLNKPKKLDKEQAEYIASLLVRTFWKKNTPFWRLLESSPSPHNDFGAKVNDITSKTPVDSLGKLAEFSHLVVMRAPLPQADESTVAYNGELLDEASSEDEVSAKTSKSEPSSVDSPTPKTASPETVDTGAKETPQAINKQPAQAPKTSEDPPVDKAQKTAPASSPAVATQDNAEKEKKEETGQKGKNSESADQQTDQSPASKSAQNENAPEQELKSQQKSDATDDNPQGNTEDNPQDKAIQGMSAPLSFFSGTAYASATTDSETSANIQASEGLTTTEKASGNKTPETKEPDTKKPGDPKTDTKNIEGASSATDANWAKDLNVAKAPSKAGQADNTIPDVWPAGALPKKMPKHPPKNPSEIDKDALRQALTLASLVEKETGLPTERPRVAGVYANRIQKNMLLQCDPTIIYGIGPEFSGPIRRSHLKDASNLYNTYIHPGLPPSPICSFGVDAFASALLPEQHSYLYFVATGLGKDHTFSKNLREHNRAVSVYRARMRNK